MSDFEQQQSPTSPDEQAESAPAPVTESSPAPQPQPALFKSGPEEYTGTKSTDVPPTPRQARPPEPYNRLGSVFTPPRFDPETRTFKTPQAQAETQAETSNVPSAPAFDHSKLLGDFFESDEADAVEALGRFYDHDPTGYARLYDAFVESHKDDLVMRLGVGRSTANHIAPEEMEAVPEHLRDAAVTIEPRLWMELQWMPEAQRRIILEGAAELDQARNEKNQREYSEWTQKVHRDANSHFEMGQRIGQEHHQKHVKSLESWEPYGANAKENTGIRETLLQSAEAWAGETPRLREMQEQAYEELQLAGLYKAQGNHQIATHYENNVRKLAEQWSETVSRRLKMQRDQLDKVFNDARSWREQNAREDEIKKLYGQPAAGGR